MDFSPRRSASKSLFPTSLGFFSMQKAKNGWTSAAPGIAKRQSSSEWLGRKTSAEYSRLPKLSPTSEDNGRDSRMSGSSKSSLSEPKVLFDDTENMTRNLSDAEENEEDFKFQVNAGEGLRRSVSLRNPDTKVSSRIISDNQVLKHLSGCHSQHLCS